jgi:hypothetical protein
MEKEIISIELAEKEWRDFLTNNDAQSLIPNEDQKSGDEKDRDEYNNKLLGFNRVVKGISTGKVVIEDGVITQTLQYPIKGKDNGETIIGKITYDKRVSVKDREEVFKGINNKDAGEVLLAQRKFWARLTGIDMAILGKIDLADSRISDQIVSVFFM